MADLNTKGARSPQVVLDDYDGTRPGICPGGDIMMPLVDGVQDDGNDPVFQYIVVSLAIGHSALQSLPALENALLDVDNCARNYQYIIQTIA
eukprot:2976733-Rhodomonas_salina.1